HTQTPMSTHAHIFIQTHAHTCTHTHTRTHTHARTQERFLTEMYIEGVHTHAHSACTCMYSFTHTDWEMHALTLSNTHTHNTTHPPTTDDHTHPRTHTPHNTPTHYRDLAPPPPLFLNIYSLNPFTVIVQCILYFLHLFPHFDTVVVVVV